MPANGRWDLIRRLKVNKAFSHAKHFAYHAVISYEDIYLISYKINVCIQPSRFFYICFLVFSTAIGNSAEKGEHHKW